MDTDRNLLFAVFALQADLLDSSHFVEACTLWANHEQTPLADLLVARGWLTPADRADVERLLARKLARHGGDVKASLAEVTTDPVRRSLAAVEDADVRESLAGLTTPGQGHALPTTDHVPLAGERYTLSRLHATGGIGRVWLARDTNLGRDVALKVLRPERATNAAAGARFMKEARPQAGGDAAGARARGGPEGAGAEALRPGPGGGQPHADARRQRAAAVGAADGEGPRAGAGGRRRATAGAA